MGSVKEKINRLNKELDRLAHDMQVELWQNGETTKYKQMERRRQAIVKQLNQIDKS